MRKIWLGLILGIMWQPVVLLQAQTNSATDTKVAVKMGTGATVKNTIVWGNDGNALSGVSAVASYLQGVKSTAPGFKDALNGDFRLLNSSPCIDEGETDLRLGDMDLWGNRRKINKVDIGAHEYTYYKVIFKKSEYIDVLLLKKTDGTEYDSLHIEPGDDFKFKLKLNFENVSSYTVSKVLIEESRQELHEENGVYSIENINADITVIIEVNPPISVSLEAMEHGRVVVKAGGKFIPTVDGSGTSINALLVEENTLIRIDTIADEGYYCSKIWAKDIDGVEVNMMDYAGDSTFRVDKEIKLGAKFSPCLYPVVSRWSTGGEVIIKNLSTGDPLFSASASSPQTVKVAYGTSLEIKAQPSNGYVLDSIVVRKKANGAEIESGNRKANPRETAVVIGGLDIKAIFSRPKCKVIWDAVTGGTILVKAGEKVLNSGDLVEQGTTIVVTPQPAEGYDFQTIKATPAGESEQALTDQGDNTYSWKVEKEVKLAAAFQVKTFQVTFETNTPEISGNKWVSPAARPYTVNYGGRLNVEAIAAEGYHCDSITVNGEKRTDGGETSLVDVKVDKVVKAWFSRKSYRVNYPSLANNGTLLVEVKDFGSTVWRTIASGTVVYHFDELRITATPNTGCEIDGNVTVNGLSYTGVITITATQNIDVRFKKQTFTVHLQKITGVTDAAPNEGAITVSDESGTYKVTLEKTDNAVDLQGVPYGTKLIVTQNCTQAYGVTQLDTVMESTPPGDILSKSSFIVTAEVTVRALIKQVSETYTVKWGTSGCGSGHSMAVTDGSTPLTQGAGYLSGISVHVNVTPATGYVYSLHDNATGATLTSPYNLQKDIYIMAKFVPLRKLKIQSPEGTEIVVSRNGVPLADGDQITAGAQLTVSIKVKTNRQDTLRALALKVGEGEIWKYQGEVTTLPIQSPEIIYHVPDNCSKDEIVIGGQAAAYYKVKYAPAVNGRLSVSGPAGNLSYNREYWLPSGTNLTLTATPDEGYDYKGTYNRLPMPDEELGLTETGKGIYSCTLPLKKHMDILAEFMLQYFDVTLKIQPENGGGSVAVHDGNANILTAHNTVASVAYGTNLSVNVSANDGNGYVLNTIKGGEEVIGSTTGIGLRVTQDTTITVIFGKRYKVIFDENQLTVKQGTMTLSNGDFVVSGTALTVSYTGNLSEGVECKKINAEWAVASSQQLLPSGNFTMPEADVTFTAETGWKQYVLKWDIVPAEVGGGISVYNVTAGNQVSWGGSVTYGDMLRTTVSLPADATDATNTRYYVESLNYDDDAGYSGNLMNSTSGALTYTGKDFKVTGNADIHAVLKHKTRKLYIRIEPQDERFAVEVTVGDQLTRFEHNGYMEIPVGETYVARTVIPQDKEEGFELKSFPDVSRKQNIYTGVMPYEDLTLRAEFGLKVFEVQIEIIPENSGMVYVMDGIGALYGNHAAVQYGTALEEIRAVPSNEYSQLKQLSAMMKGIEQFAGNASGGYRIDRVTDTVKIRAEFEPLYKAIAVASVHGTLGLTCADTNAAGHFYQAGTELEILLTPDKGYEVNELTVNGQVLEAPSAGGKIVYVIPRERKGKDLNFEVTYVLKKVKVRFVTEGPGSLIVDGLPGGQQVYDEQHPNGIREGLDYFTSLQLAVNPQAGNYRVKSFIIRTDDTYVHEVAATDTLIQLEGNTVVEVHFAKFYQVIYEQPEHGRLEVTAGEAEIVTGTLCDGGQNLNVQVIPFEGYELNTLTWNRNDVVNHTIALPLDADYDIVEIAADLRIKTQLLTVVQPEEGQILVEKLGPDGWETLDVSQPQVLDYWTKIRAKVSVNLPDKYITEALIINGEQQIQPGEEWVIKTDIVMTAQIVPRKYTVTFEQPEKGKLRVMTAHGEQVESGSSWPYLTKLNILLELDDEEGYHVGSIMANGEKMEDQSVWILEEDTYFSASILLNRWRITSSKDGNGTLRLLLEDQTELFSPEDSVGHYEKIRIMTAPDEGWMLHSLDVYGADPDAANIFVVEGDVDVVAVFKQSEPWIFPVIFTPNSDGINDIWTIGGLWQSPENTLEIYNRLEQRVYKASPYQNDWEGVSDDGDILPAGNYVYKFTLGSGKVYMGMLSIIRN